MFTEKISEVLVSHAHDHKPATSIFPRGFFVLSSRD
jgi:hypothetical protein